MGRSTTWCARACGLPADEPRAPPQRLEQDRFSASAGQRRPQTATRWAPAFSTRAGGRRRQGPLLVSRSTERVKTLGPHRARRRNRSRWRRGGLGNVARAGGDGLAGGNGSSPHLRADWWFRGGGPCSGRRCLFRCEQRFDRRHRRQQRPACRRRGARDLEQPHARNRTLRRGARCTATSMVTAKASGVPSPSVRNNPSRSAGRSAQVCSSWRSPFDSHVRSGTSRTRMRTLSSAVPVNCKGSGALARWSRETGTSNAVVCPGAAAKLTPGIISGSPWAGRSESTARSTTHPAVMPPNRPSPK